MKNTIKKIIISAILLLPFTLGNFALASEVTGTLSSGANTVGNTLTGTVTGTSQDSSNNGGGGSIAYGGGGGGQQLRATGGAGGSRWGSR